MRPLLHTLLVVAPLLAGCGSAGGSAAGGNAVGSTNETPTDTDPHTAQSSDETSHTAQTPDETSPSAPALPSATACHLDTDCSVAVSAPDPSKLCCDVTVTAQPIANAYLQAVAQWRTSACANVSCPPGALPGARLAPCGYEPRCVASACINACGQPPRPPTPHISAPPS